MLKSIGSKASLGSSMDLTGPVKGTSKFLTILEPLSGNVYHSYIIHPLAPKTMLEGHFKTLPRLG